MIKDTTPIQKDLLAANVLKHYLPVLLKKLDDHISFLQKVEILQAKIIRHTRNINDSRQRPHVGEKIKLLKVLIDYKQDLNVLVEAYVNNSQEPDVDPLFSGFMRAMNDYLETLPVRISLEQDSNHFIAGREDHFFLKMIKRGKKALYGISKTPERSLNFIRRVFNTHQKPLKSWTHNIYLRRLATFYFREKLAYLMKDKIEDLQRLICNTTLPIWRKDETVNALIGYFVKGDLTDFNAALSEQQVSETISRITDEKTNIQHSLLAIFDNLYRDFETAFHKAGTIELPNICYNKIRVRYMNRLLNKAVLKIEKGWGITRRALFDDWGIDVELYQLMFTSLEGHYEAFEDMKRRLDREIYPSFENTMEFLANCKARIEVLSKLDDQLKALEKERVYIRASLSDKMLPEISDLVLKLDFPVMLEELSGSIQHHVGRISNQRAISKITAYTKPFKPNDIHYISPFDLISFECLPKLTAVAIEARNKMESTLKSIWNAIPDIGKIAEYGIESAIDYSKGTLGHENPGKIAAEGIERTIERTDQVRSQFGSTIDLVEREIFAGLRIFIDELEKFTDNSNIIEIRVRIIRGKSIDRIKTFRKGLVAKIRQLIPTLVQAVRKMHQYGVSRLSRLSKKYGLTSEKEVITADLAEFLTEAQQSILKLPYVYQRLFKTEPLTEKRFFMGRHHELQILLSAFERWTKEQYTPTLIIGEKGSGATSLINIFLGELDKDIRIVRLKPDSTLHTESDLVHFLNDRINQSFKGLDEWVDYFNTISKTIIILEDCHRLYLKKVNGFELLQKLNELIHRTGRKIFWILTFTEYAYAYLDRTIMISEHYRNIIKLGTFKDEAMIEIIDQRHRVSGFNIAYEPSATDLAHKKYKSASEEGRQAFLKNEFFYDLTRIAKSNIRIALFYWLSSVKEVNDNIMRIKSLKDLDMSFLNSLSSAKLFAMGTMIQHEILCEEDFGKVLHVNPELAGRFLHSLYHDGVLLYEPPYYLINPLLYRQITDILKDKNILH